MHERGVMERPYDDTNPARVRPHNPRQQQQQPPQTTQYQQLPQQPNQPQRALAAQRPPAMALTQPMVATAGGNNPVRDPVKNGKEQQQQQEKQPESNSEQSFFRQQQQLQDQLRENEDLERALEASVGFELNNMGG